MEVLVKWFPWTHRSHFRLRADSSCRRNWISWNDGPPFSDILGLAACPEGLNCGQSSRFMESSSKWSFESFPGHCPQWYCYLDVVISFKPSVQSSQRIFTNMGPTIWGARVLLFQSHILPHLSNYGKLFLLLWCSSGDDRYDICSRWMLLVGFSHLI